MSDARVVKVGFRDPETDEVINPREMRMTEMRDAGRAFAEAWLVKRVCRCGREHHAFKFLPADLPCTSCIVASRNPTRLPGT